MSFSIQLTKDFSNERVADLICCGFEGGVGYWCTIVDFVTPTNAKSVFEEGHLYKHIDYPLLEGGAVLCQAFDPCDDEDEDGMYCDPETGERNPILSLDRSSILKGLNIMAKQYPSHFNDFLNEQEDAETGDVFIQCCLLGNIVYG